ncbi:amidohydrolase family protein [Streptomyces sp. NPDC002490]|uniref:amidohydrolase family protein n=1 Tax=Streptomyces sp. NPDC002490 TaxID=3154416 RepID=UPI00331AC03A
MTLSRRTMLKGGAVLGGAPAVELGVRTSPARAAAPGIAVDRATNTALSCDPVSGTLVHDAVNALWAMPLTGGTARRLTEDAEDATWPSFFPGGTEVAFQSFREGVYDLCAVDLATRAVRRLTSGPQYDVEPAVSPDGSRIAYVSDAGDTSAVWLLDPATGRTRAVVGTDDDRAYRSPTWHPDGERIAYVVGETVLETLHLPSGRRTTVRTAPAGQVLRGAGYGPGGALAHTAVDGPRARLYVDGRPLTDEAEEPGPFPPAWASATELLYGGADGTIRRRATTPGSPAGEVPFTAVLAAAGTAPVPSRPVTAPERAPVRGLAGPVLSPDASTVCFRALGALWLHVLGGATTKIVDGGDPSDPHWFPDGRSLVYSSDRDGSPQLWRHTVGGGPDQRLTDLADGALLPSVSPAGDRIAFQDGNGALRLYDTAARTSRELLPAADHPGKASWSPDGTRLSMAVLVTASERETAGFNRVLTLDVATGTSTVRPIAPHRSIATRGHDGPVWAPDGKSLVVVAESLVHRVPVAPDGTVTGPPVPLSDRVADAVSVSATGHVLFLSLGELVLLPPARRRRTARHTVPLVCVRRPAAPRTVIRAGALWDGRAEGYRRDVDITVENGTVVSVEPVRAGAPRPDVDAGTATVIPGLIDVHNHWHLRGRQWGSRQGPLWLAYGVTTSRSTGDPAYRMAETREAIHSGAVPGPRFLGSGEPLDGARVRFPFMRTVTSEAQLDRELQRVTALGYHVLKSYQRLPVRLERRLIARLRHAGVPAVSHYLYPAAATGFNGMEHTGGENRLGYSRTLSYAGGRAAEDTVRLLSGSGMYVSTTLLFAHELFLEGRDLIEDRRTRTLFPAAEYAALLARAEHAATPAAELDRAWTAGDVDLLLRVHRAGGTVVAGTDAPLDFPGIGIHQNLRALVRHGFSAVDALRTATVNAAVALGAQGVLGVVAPGARADLLVVDGDPLRDVRAAARVREVFTDGHRHPVEELLTPFDRPPTGPARPGRPAAEHPPRPSVPAAPGCCRPRPTAPTLA